MIIHNMSIFTLCIIRIGTLFMSRIEIVTLSINLKLYQGFLKNVATTGVATQIDTLKYYDLTLGKAAVAIDGVIEGAYHRYDLKRRLKNSVVTYILAKRIEKNS